MSRRSRGWTDLEDIEVDSGSGEKQHRAMPSLVLLGPQRRLPRVAEAVAELGLESACAITAGWQERADEVGELESHLRIPVLRLDLYRRAEHVFEDDPKFFDAYRARQNKLKAQQRVYRLRLNFLMKQCLEVWKLPAGSLRPEEERSHALEMVRELDRHHLAAVDAIHFEFEHRYRPLARSAVCRQRQELKALLASSHGALVAGGHVAVLLNRLRLFGLKSLLAGHPIVAWAGGAMVLSQRLVLFHDNPPQGPGFPEVLVAGLGLYSRVQPFPDPTGRLRLDDSDRLEILSRRLHPQQCLLLDPGKRAKRVGSDWEFDCPSLDPKGKILDEAWASTN